MLRPGVTRFILAMLVVISHFSNAIMLGKFAVCCFFILSGYWITAMFEHKYSKKEDSIKVFYLSRLWRLFPMYYLFTILGLFSTILFDDYYFISFSGLHGMSHAAAIISNLFIVGGTASRHRILGPAWSLEVEIQFYLMFPLFAYLNSKYRNALAYSLPVIIASLFCYLFFKDRVEFNILPYLCLFLFGSLVYQYKVKFSPGIEKAAAGLFLLALASQYAIPSLHRQFMEEHSYYYFFATLALIILATPVLINSVYVPTSATDKAYGEMSYIVYLSHWVWIQPYYAHIWQHPHDYSNIAKLGYASLVIAATLASSYIAYRFVDRAFEKNRHKWVNSQGNKTVAAT
jgi:peptidoglycan/LPS O-acetylase OafA/YrhL